MIPNSIDYFLRQSGGLGETSTAGIAAGLAISNGQPMRDLDGSVIRAKMAARGDVLLAKNYERE